MRTTDVASNRVLHIPHIARSLPEGWRWARLDDVCSGVFDCPHSTPTLSVEGPYVVRTQDILTGTFRFDQAARVSEQTYTERVVRAVPEHGDLLFSREGTYFGIAAEVPPMCRVCLGQRMVLLRPNRERIDSRFLKYWLNSPILASHVEGHRDGTVAERLNMPTIRALPVPVAPLKSQQRIGRILGALDDKIELNRRTNQTLEAMVRALFKSWFVDFDPVREIAAGRQPAGLDATTARLFPSEFEDSPVGKVPKGWLVMPLPEAIQVNPTRSLSRGIVAPYLEMGNMPTASARAIAWEQREFGSGMRFVNGDTLVARITPCLENGKTAYVDFLRDGEVGWGSTEYIVLRSKPPLPATYSYSLARTDDFRSYVIRNMTGTSGRQRAPAECLDKYPVVVPDPKVAARFGEFADHCIALMKNNDEESRTIAATRDAMLPQLLSGRLRLSLP